MSPLYHLAVRGGRQRHEAELKNQEHAAPRENEPARRKGGAVALGGVLTNKNI